MPALTTKEQVTAMMAEVVISCTRMREALSYSEAMLAGETTEEPPPPMPGQERRKAATRQRILAAAQTLFGEHGYAETSVEDIAVAAGLGIRTIYLHFPSKAAILLAYFDGWLDALVDAIRQRPLDEPVVDSMRAALAAMADAGWTDRAEHDIRLAYPFVEQLASGPPDIAGHVMQRWLSAIAQLTNDAATRSGATPGSLAPYSRASAVFAAWVSNMAAVQASQRGEPLPVHGTGNTIGLEILGLVTSGAL
jgi:AcrR family transcriptional regulator